MDNLSIFCTFSEFIKHLVNDNDDDNRRIPVCSTIDSMTAHHSFMGYGNDQNTFVHCGDIKNMLTLTTRPYIGMFLFLFLFLLFH